MKRCFKCVSNQKCSTGNLQSLRGRCEMCSPCHFCHDRSTLHALRCQIPPPSRYSNSHALDGAVRKPRENLAQRPAPRPTHWPQEGFTNKNPTFVHHWGKLPEYSGFMEGKNRKVGERRGKSRNRRGVVKQRKIEASWQSWLTWWMACNVLKVDRILWWVPQVPTAPWLSISFFSCENNLFLITSWISSPAPMTSRGLSGLSLCVSVFVCVCVCAHLRMTLSSEVSIEFWLNEISTPRESVRSEAFVLCVVGTGPAAAKKSCPHAERLWHW